VSERPQYITMHDVPALLRERMGVRISYSTVTKKFRPRVGDGPKPVGYWSGRPYYDPAAVLDWAAGRFMPTRNGAA